MGSILTVSYLISIYKSGDMMESADMTDSKSVALASVWVQVPLSLLQRFSSLLSEKIGLHRKRWTTLVRGFDSHGFLFGFHL